MDLSEDSLRRAFEEEKALAAHVTRAEQVPSNYAAITIEWLSDVICKNTPQARVTGFSFDEPDNGSTNRQRIFIEYNEQGRAAGLPASVFCKATTNLQNRITLAVTGVARAEADFYNLVRNRLQIEASQAIYARLNPKTFAYLIMMRDLGAEGVTFPQHTTLLTREQANSMVETLADLHATFFESADIGTPKLPFPSFPDFWSGLMRALPTYPDCCGRAWIEAQSVIPPRLFVRGSEIWPATEKAAVRHGALPRTFLHGDVHVRNWYMTKDGRMGLHDWQLMTIGHWSRDFAYAVTTLLPIEQRRAWLPELLSLYLDRLASKGGEATDFDSALRNVRQQLFSALSFWTITLIPAEQMPDMQPRDTTLELIKRITTAIDDLDALESFDR